MLYHTHHKTLFYNKKAWNNFGYGIKPDGKYEINSRGWGGYKPSEVYPLNSKQAVGRRWEYDMKRFEFLVMTVATEWAIAHPEDDPFDAAFAATQEPNLFTDIWGTPIPSLPPKDAQWLQDLFEQVVKNARSAKPLDSNLCMIAPPGYYSKWQWYQWGYYIPEDTPIALFLKTADEERPLFTFEDVFPMRGEAALARRLLYHREKKHYEQHEQHESGLLSGIKAVRHGHGQAAAVRYPYHRDRPHHRRNR